MLRAHIPTTGPTLDREISPERTLASLQPHLDTFGVTRIADVTGLDRLGLPVFHAICPRSADSISVYSGKGATSTAAKVSALMEAAERYAASTVEPAAVTSSYAELIAAGRTALDPRTHTVEIDPDWTPDTRAAWVEGVDLLSGESIAVPRYAAGYYLPSDDPACFTMATTNGLASGNSLEEAIFHGLCEIVERDEWTMADVVGRHLPEVLRSEGFVADDRLGALVGELWPVVDQSTLPREVGALVDRFTTEGLELTLRSLTATFDLPVIVATVTGRDAAGLSMTHLGFGAHTDAAVAITRSLTEVAQSRAGDIAAIREDLSYAVDEVDRGARHMQRTAGRAAPWPDIGVASPISFVDLPSIASGDLGTDLRLVLDRLREAGLDRVIMVDLSPSDVPVSVCRILIPGAESWGVDRSRLGERATATWQDARTVLTAPDLPAGGVEGAIA